MIGLVGYRYKDGSVVCVECDVYPPETEHVSVLEVTEADVCKVCERPLTEVWPVGGSA